MADMTLVLDKDFKPPKIPKYAVYNNRSSNEFTLFATKDRAMRRMAASERGMPLGGVLYALDGHSWREIWRWQPPLTCAICDKEWSRWGQAEVLTAPKRKKWFEYAYVHAECKAGTGI